MQMINYYNLHRVLQFIFRVLLMSTSQLEQQTRQKNRKKLIQQNVRLHTELIKLQKEIELLQENLDAKVQEEPNFSELKAQIEIQQKQIRQLKEAVDTGRQSNAKENVYYIKKQEDQLLFIKQQLQTLQKEKEVVSRAHQDKLQKLAANQPLIKHKEELQKTWNETKKDNRQMSLKLVELQRQIRKFHNLKQMAKSSNGSNSTTEQMQLATLESEIFRMSSQMKMKEIKWRPNGQVLDNQFFSNKNVLQSINKKIQELEKQQGVWRLRAAALRDQSQIKTDRKRLSKIISITKPQPIIKIQSTPKQEVKKPTIQTILQRQIKDSIKNDKFVDLVRVSSTPSAASSLKKSIQLQPILVQTPVKKKNSQIALISPKDKKQVVIPLVPAPSIKKPENVKATLKKQKSQKDLIKQSSKESLKISKNEQVIEQNKNGSNWLGRRGKIKSKQANATALAEIIQKKAEQVKQINKKLQKEQKERSVSSPKKKREKVNSLQRVETQFNQNKAKDKLQPKQSKLLSPGKISLKQNGVKTTLQKKQELNKPQNKKVQAKGKNISKEQNQKKLVQKLDISAKINNLQIDKTKIQPKKQIIPKQLQQIKTPRQSSPQENKRKQKNLQTKPSSPFAKQQPIFQIFVSDTNPKIRLASNNEIKNPDLDDEKDGIPKIIKRKKKPEGELVTIGTST